jgi:pyridinium-3,5-bisthiocarboxylic acid mononucleotide nickel chelatase
MAQVDDAPGELLGYVVQELARVGATNVQLLSSLGKKGRPGYVLLVDIDAEDEPDVAGLLVGELGIWGYRVLESQHKHFEIKHHRTQLELHWADDVTTFPLRLKRVLHDGRFIRAKAEHEDLVAITAALAGRRATHLAVLKAAVETAVGSDEPGHVVRVLLDGPPRTEP